MDQVLNSNVSAWRGRLLTVTAPLFAAVLLSACGADAGKYPSLAIRDAERVSGTPSPAQPEREEAPSTPPEGEDAQISAALTKATNAFQRFQSESSAVAAMVSAFGNDPASEEKRASALVGLADLSALRGQTVQALAQLDQLETEAATVFGPLEDIQRAQTAVAFLLEQQDATLATLSAKLGQ